MGAESSLQSHCFALLRKMGYVYARNNGGGRVGANGQRIKFGLRLGNSVGDSDDCGGPDALLLFPGSRVLFVEFKAPGKPLRRSQRDWVAAARHARVVRVDSVQGLLRAITEFEQ